MTMRHNWIPGSPRAPFREPRARAGGVLLPQPFTAEPRFCQTILAAAPSPNPSPLRALLLCAHVISHLAGATPVPQATTAASPGMAKDPCSSRPPALPAAKQCPVLTVTWPAVEVSLNGTLTLSCTACSRFPHFSILYWLGNGSFIEHLPGRLREGSTRREYRGKWTQLWRPLVLEELSPALRDTNFSCVLMDPGQTVQRHLVLAQLWAGPKTCVPPATGSPSLQPGPSAVPSRQ